MDILLQLVFSGIALGMIYAVIAFGYQLTFATSGTLTFAPGDTTMTFTVEVIDPTSAPDKWLTIHLSGASTNALVANEAAYGYWYYDYGYYDYGYSYDYGYGYYGY